MLSLNSVDLALSANLCCVYTLLATTHTAFQLSHEVSNIRLTKLPRILLSSPGNFVDQHIAGK